MQPDLTTFEKLSNLTNLTEMKIDLSKNLNDLEGIVWEKPEYSSRLVIRCHELRVKKLSDFDIEDLRLMIGQNIGMDYLIPLAIQKLKEDIFAEGDFYEGDLLQNVLCTKCEFWIKHPEYVPEINDIIAEALEKLPNLDTIESIRTSILKAIATFKACNNI